MAFCTRARAKPTGVPGDSGSLRPLPLRKRKEVQILLPTERMKCQSGQDRGQAVPAPILDRVAGLLTAGRALRGLSARKFESESRERRWFLSGWAASGRPECP